MWVRKTAALARNVLLSSNGATALLLECSAPSLGMVGMQLWTDVDAIYEVGKNESESECMSERASERAR